jgi:MYXO-CTERM domain-containing protein
MQQKKPPAPSRPRSWVTRLLGAAGILAGLSTVGDINATPAAFTFVPPNPGWVTARLAGNPLVDPEGDSPTARDIVGDAANPMLFVASDATHLYFRLRLDSDPLKNPLEFGSFGWGCLIDSNSDPTTFEYSTLVNGVVNPDEIYFYRNTVTTNPNDPTEQPDQPPVVTTLDPLVVGVKHAQVSVAGSNFGGNADYFMDWAIELGPALAAGFNPAIPARYYCGSANNGSQLGADCSGGTICGTLSSQFSDPIACGPLGCSICGDGQKQATEGCDDGNTTNGDGCNSVCLLELGQPCAGVSPACASGFCDPAGNICACDATADCPMGQLCATTPNPNQCVAPGCGNTVLEGSEGCDDGNTTGGDGCSAVCLLELGRPCLASGVCESGFCDPAGNLCACDATADCPMGQLCNTTANPNLCVAAGCGNFVLELGEGCDDGNTTDNDGCNQFCLLEIGQPCAGVDDNCASAFCDPSGNVCQCDSDEDCLGGQACNVTLNPNQCVPMGCGNGLLEMGEGCDDNNLNTGDGCNAQCKRELGQPCAGNNNVCASTFCDPAGNICACDEFADCPGIQLCNTTPNPNICVNPGCGNGIVEVTEACDDGNTISGDGCNSICFREIGQACTLPGQCASGFCDPANNACACDQSIDCPMGQLCNTVANPNICVMPGCGNNVLEAGEACEDGNIINGDGCNATCLKELGQSCLLSGECASNSCDIASFICVCDQNADCPMGQLCNFVADPNVCVNPGCGNFVLEAGEACEDGNTTNGDGCNSVCLRELGQACMMGSQCVSAFCDSANNACACDQDADCSNGQLCNLLSNPNTCVNPGCSNGVVEATEACDDGNSVDGDGCNSVCLREIGQVCSMSGQCASGLCDTGLCACDENADCSGGQLCNTVANPNICVNPGCGNGIVEVTEACDDGNTMSGDGCNSMCLREIGQMCSASMQCASGLCDPTGNICACDQDADCSGGQLCNTVASPNACVNPGCANGVLEMNEGCDDGNTVPGDGCGSTCLLEIGEPCTLSGTCQSGACDPQSGTCECDEDADCPMGNVCDLTPDPNACIAGGCGNGVIEAGEGCDDGNMMDGDGCTAACTKEIGEMCTDGTECNSGNCDGTTNVCVCDIDDDCPMGQTCDTDATPHACVMEDGCRDDSECTGGLFCDEPSRQCVECTQDPECTSGTVCDEASFTCVKCVVDEDCKAEATCDAAKNICVAAPVIIEGGGILCATSTVATNDNNWPFALLGLLALGMTRRRRR